MLAMVFLFNLNVGTANFHRLWLPSSTDVCKNAWDNILKGELDSRQRPHNLVMLMPRLTER